MTDILASLCRNAYSLYNRALALQAAEQRGDWNDIMAVAADARCAFDGVQFDMVQTERAINSRDLTDELSKSITEVESGK